MKDIELVRSGVGTYDWRFSMGDLSVVNGIIALRNSVIHAVLLHLGELSQEVYKNKGSLAYSYAKAKDTETNRKYIEESLTATIKEVDGVYDAKVKVETKNAYTLVSEVTITRNNGDEVVIGAI